jgi:predicted  nucleic acid-binding Zn-ribbon protein
MTTSIKHITTNVNTRNKKFIDDESQKISRWAEDQTYALEQELQDFKRRIKEKERAFKNETDNAARLDIQKEILSLQRQVNQKRQSLFALEDEIDQRRNELILQIEASLNQTIHEEELFTIYWKIK